MIIKDSSLHMMEQRQSWSKRAAESLSFPTFSATRDGLTRPHKCVSWVRLLVRLEGNSLVLVLATPTRTSQLITEYSVIANNATLTRFTHSHAWAGNVMVLNLHRESKPKAFVPDSANPLPAKMTLSSPG